MTADSARRVPRLLAGLLGVLLLWAAVSKLANPPEFLGSIYAYKLPLPVSFLKATAVVLPWLELLAGLLLLGGLWTETALCLVNGLFVVFVVATGQAWARGIDITCGCFDLTVFGLSKNPEGVARFLESVAFAFFRNLALLALSAFLLRRALRPQAVAKSALTPE